MTSLLDPIDLRIASPVTDLIGSGIIFPFKTGLEAF
jgi:hypothetical protein